ncbi:hypothetical protein CLU93_3727 [Janthinobacterium sp. 35]|uniref:hypothetical protein n=1 Tax=Janthinobacterium sp. 35 TaxID=2035210 RepID=UPI000C194AFD|nr:hypothetical protein [Janthinobacterium sp. 35]PIG29419.1 hypothetical protein CLU93_3727 [Janthinobacterium sp. 35]
MAYFTTRVELHGASAADYTVLHEKMGAMGFTDIIVGDNGIRYKMSPGEYNFEGTATIEQVILAAKAAATHTKRNWAVFVSEAVKRSWEGLAII